jgi:hypothetical protein
MIQKRNISTFAVGLCLLAFMLFSALPAKAFKTTEPALIKAYDKCLKKGKQKQMKTCFRKFKEEYNSKACLVDKNSLIRLSSSQIIRSCGF